jgi:hypothetical protein
VRTRLDYASDGVPWQQTGSGVVIVLYGNAHSQGRAGNPQIVDLALLINSIGWVVLGSTVVRTSLCTVLRLPG